ncbi:hypothetical protein B0H15DRAFT_1003432 [Mycena belliarum]|uniref:Uncharacterized protein n=1 Tax=Mycena belliarum TaxID=1033014 RepID=A0AAD6TU26_9AGAR|nr:hypothetical protein B0H15DRAFT_1003432 [Mycena belliae]
MSTTSSAFKSYFEAALPWLIAHSPSLLYSQQVRVYTLRLAITTSGLLIVILSVSWRSQYTTATEEDPRSIYPYYINASSLVFAHHLLTGFLKFIFMLQASLVLLTLTLSLVGGAFDFLHGCGPANPPYTRARIMLNRSLARPLVRGEASFIVVLRAVVLTLIVLAMAMFAIYTTLLKPVLVPIYTREYQVDHSPNYVKNLGIYAYTDPLLNAKITFWGGMDGEYLLESALTTNAFQVFIQLSNATTELCGTSRWSQDPFPVFIAHCPVPWQEIRNVSVSVNFTALPTVYPASAVYVAPGRGPTQGIIRYTTPVVLLRGADILAPLTWLHRRTMSDFALGLLGSWTRLYPFLDAEISGIQPYPVAHTPHPQIGRVCFVQISVNPWRFVQDYLTVSSITGLAALGGMWTFVDGIFAFIFGAKIFYFLFALEEEGGRRGSALAGVVALIRDRHLSIPSVESDQETDVKDQDLEASNLDEIPLQNMVAANETRGRPMGTPPRVAERARAVIRSWVHGDCLGTSSEVFNTSTQS